jgi:hypothetical protein
MALSPVANELEICIWARHGVQMNEADLPDSDLRLFVIDRVREIKSQYPKLYTGDTLNIVGMDLDAYCTAVGYLAASDWWNSPSSKDTRGKSLIVEMGGVKETSSDAVSASLSGDLLSRAQSAIERISVLRPEPRKCSGSPFFGAAGYRRGQDRRQGYY